jgi:hypothetical protein
MKRDLSTIGSAVLERAVKTFCQVLAALLVASSTDLLTTDWRSALSVAGMAAFLSVLTSVGSAQFGSNGPAAFGPEEVPPK